MTHKELIKFLFIEIDLLSGGIINNYYYEKDTYNIDNTFN